MSVNLVSISEADTQVRVNDVVIEIATANGSGSQSANTILTRSIFQMGISVGAKNLFPSNIQGLPTWFTIRANKDGWTARRADVDVMVCMNPESVQQDIDKLKPGAVLVIRDELAGLIERTDLEVIRVPFGKLVVPVCEITRLRKLVVNVMYVAVLGYLLGIEYDEIVKALDKQFGGKAKAIEINLNALKAAWDWSSETLKPLTRYRIERIPGGTENQILVDGNTACAMGAIWGGLTVLAWYPITPSSSIAEMAIELLDEVRRDPLTGKATYAVVQAEDELASIGMVLGAGWAGARAMTATSGPGISLMAEQAGLAYFAEVPSVIIDVQRMGPSTGLPTRTCQNDILKAYFLSHGDCKHLMLIPGNLEECFDFSCESFNVAERFQTLVFVMIDLDLGMNVWQGGAFKYPDKPIDRGKVLTAEDLQRLGGFERYGDPDGDGIPYRTLPGTPNPLAAYFTRGTGHTTRATYSEKPEDWKANMDRLVRKFESAREELPAPIVEEAEGAKIGVIAYGTSDLATREAIALLADQHGIQASYLRIRALPAHQAVYDFIARYERVYLVEQNRDGQMAAILQTEAPLEQTGQSMPRPAEPIPRPISLDACRKLRSVRIYDGLAIDARSVLEQIMEIELHEGRN